MVSLTKRLRSKPKQRLNCQGGYYASPCPFTGIDGELYTPILAVWKIVSGDGVWISCKPLWPMDDVFAATTEVLDELVNFQGGVCPQTVKVTCPKLAAYLGNIMKGAGIKLELCEHLPGLSDAVDEVLEQLAENSGDRATLISTNIHRKLSERDFR